MQNQEIYLLFGKNRPEFKPLCPTVVVRPSVTRHLPVDLTMNLSSMTLIATLHLAHLLRDLSSAGIEPATLKARP